MGKDSIVELAALDTIIATQQLHMSPSQLHGMLSGYLAGGGDEDPAVWPVRCLGKAVHDSELQCLFFQIQHHLASLHCDFQLLLVDNNLPLPAQAQSLIDWVEGFLAGLSFSGIAASALQQGNVKDAVEDLTDITRLDIKNILEDEASQKHFTELHEYVRTLALFIFAEFHFLASD